MQSWISGEKRFAKVDIVMTSVLLTFLLIAPIAAQTSQGLEMVADPGDHLLQQRHQPRSKDSI